MMKYTLKVTNPDGNSQSVTFNNLPLVFIKIEERLPLILKNKEILTIIIDDDSDKSVEFPSRGVYFSKDLMYRLDYVLVDGVYEYYIHKAKIKKCDNYVKIKYKKVTNLGRLNDLNQFKTYLYTEGYIDEKPNN